MSWTDVRNRSYPNCRNPRSAGGAPGSMDSAKSVSMGDSASPPAGWAAVSGVGTQSMPGNPGAAIRPFARGDVVSPPF